MAEEVEVYNSEFTAEDFEKAIRAVPNIGENGNWFIGDEDTGVYAGGVKVTGAEVGQTIKVAAVDENGVPTAWEPSDLDAWDVHYKVNIAEPLENGFEINEVEGKPLRLKEIIALVKLQNGSDTNQWMGCSITTLTSQRPDSDLAVGYLAGPAANAGGAFPASGAYVYFVYSAKLLPDNGRVVWEVITPNGQSGKFAGGSNSNWLNNWLDYDQVDCITGIECQNNLGAGTSQGYGTEIELWGKSK